jgi:hypothetical protein
VRLASRRLSSTDAPSSTPTAAGARGSAGSAQTDEPVDAEEDREDDGCGEVAASFMDDLFGRGLDQRIER